MGVYQNFNILYKQKYNNIRNSYYYYFDILYQQKYNPHHDELGRFSSSDGAVLIVHQDGTREKGPMHPDNLSGSIHKIQAKDFEETEAFKKVLDGTTDLTEKYDPEKGDAFLFDLQHELGADGKPDIVSKEELDKHIANGEPELFRGVSQKQFGDQFKKGDLYAGSGCYGNGTYTATGKNAKQYAKKYAGAKGTVMRMSLKKGAKIKTYSQVSAMRKEHMNSIKGEIEKAKQHGDEKRVTELGQKLFATRDIGRFAVSQGIDAVDLSEEDPMYLVLNRSALRVQEDDDE